MGKAKLSFLSLTALSPGAAVGPKAADVVSSNLYVCFSFLGSQ
jgi:hypothetical protein